MSMNFAAWKAFVKALFTKTSSAERDKPRLTGLRWFISKASAIHIATLIWEDRLIGSVIGYGNYALWSLERKDGSPIFVNRARNFEAAQLALVRRGYRTTLIPASAMVDVYQEVARLTAAVTERRAEDQAAAKLEGLEAPEGAPS